MIEMRLPGIDVGPTGPTHPLTDIDTPTLITAAQSVARLDTATRWYLGDLVCELHHRDGPTALVTLAEQWHHQATLAECAAVAATFTPDRRFAGLSWSHHANVARTVRDTADQDQWLERAETDGLSPRALRAKIVGVRHPPRPPPLRVGPVNEHDVPPSAGEGVVGAQRDRPRPTCRGGLRHRPLIERLPNPW